MNIDELFIKNEELTSNVERKKHLQKIKILKNLYFEGPKTNTEICERFNISSPTSIRLLNQLIDEGWVKKSGRGKSAGGRKPDLYKLEGNSFYVMGIQLERSRLKIAIFDNHNKKVADFKDFFELGSEVGLVDHIYGEANKLIETSGIDIEKLLGIGISMPGLVSSKEGRNFTYFIQEEESESLENILKRKFNKPIFILNDAKSACVAESNFGMATNLENVLVISMDWGIGLGVIIDGKVYQGSSGFAGEFGHIPLIDDGQLCHCGKRGCLETVASGLALTRMAQEGIRAGESTSLNLLSEEDLRNLQPEKIIEAANMGDQFSINILSKIGINLGKGLAILIQLFNPELIILEGKFAKASQFITVPIQQSINTYCMAQLREKTKISLSSLGEDSVLLGSVATVMENIFGKQISLINNN
ncbi:ROK family transcriptional regulator [Salinimicrobium sp. MT39]|uniref:ROK family transcriptional regulator n=1 Tax=Salinimicrobium profundisediminis TaxID=2994553 RepID=A0A9X3I147_9FLAO|nr:ROK family transcriptional regulator [Salinimicrobium profundisediminis]MCX2838566.1 ROK family transcriptional regulator [Salinimicrobium profundisediminis]